MEGLEMLYWIKAWGAYHQKNFGVAIHFLERIASLGKAESFGEDYSAFKEMLETALEGTRDSETTDGV